MILATGPSSFELPSRLKIGRKTVINYIDILEKSFVVNRLAPFSRNPRREIGKQSKIYFLDPGIRNALAGNFNDLALRVDRGAVWENFLIVERMKAALNRGKKVQNYYWRSYSGAEVAYLELDATGNIQAFEFKSGRTQRARGGEAFSKASEVEVKVVNEENYLDFIRG
jgi:hypothetical protein